MPTPRSGESKEDYIGRCIPQLKDEGKEQKQAIAICYSMWERRNENKEIENKLDRIIECISKNT